MSQKENKKIIFDVGPEGSLGLLALGAVGLKAWREKRGELKIIKEPKKAKSKNEKK